MLQVINSAEYAQAMDTILDSYLTTSAPLREVTEAVLTQFVSSETFARAMRELLDTYLTSSAAFRDTLQANMAQVLAQSMITPGAEEASLIDRFDPSGLWRSMSTANLNAWSSLFTAASFQQALESTMADALTRLNMPTRAGVTSLTERLHHLDRRLDDIETKLGAAQGRPSTRVAGRRSGITENMS